MKNYLLVGRTGVGKSSFVNAAFGIQLARIDHFEPCTKVVEYFRQGTPYGDVCLIDTPGLAESDDAQDQVYLAALTERIRDTCLEALIYISPLNETRFRPEEQTALRKLNQSLGSRIWQSSWLVLTFAASVAPERRQEAADKRIVPVASFLTSLSAASPRGPRFAGFRQILLVDNVVPNWTSEGKPLDSYLG